MGRKPKPMKSVADRRGPVAEHVAPLPIDRASSARLLRSTLESEALHCRALSPSHPREQAALLHAAIEALAEKDAEIARLQAQVTKDANRLDWAAGLVQPDHLRDQFYAWAELARNVLNSD